MYSHRDRRCGAQHDTAITLVVSRIDVLFPCLALSDFEVLIIGMMY